MNFIRKKPTELRLKIKNFLEEKDLFRYPLFVSYPRSGSHWINSIMELYFNRPRLRKGSPSLLPDAEKRDDWMWIHDHDLKLKVINKLKKNKNPRYNKILFLYRNPSQTIFSHLNAKQKDFNDYGYLFGKNSPKEEKPFSEKTIFKETNYWIKYHREYLQNPGNLKITPIKYENFLDKTKRAKEFKKICRHFNLPFDEERIESLFEQYGNINLAPYRKNSKMEGIKKDFLERWEDKINQKVKDSELDI